MFGGTSRPHALRALAVVVAALLAIGLTSCAGVYPQHTSAVPGGPVPESGQTAAPTSEPTSESSEPTPDPTPRPTTSGPGPLGGEGRWRLDWKDEFSGDTVNTSRWRPNWLTNEDDLVSTPINRAEQSCYDPANATVKNGSLRLEAEQKNCRTHDGKSFAHTSAIVQSADDYRFTYGFAEARIYLPPADGTKAPQGSCGPNWGVFMLNGRNHPADGEIDVMECLSRNDVAWHYHWGSDDEPQVAGGYPDAWRGAMPGTSGWHTFGVDWEPGRLTFYYDGDVVGVQEEGVTGTPHYLVMLLGISGSAVEVPQTMKVDWVRVWKRR